MAAKDDFKVSLIGSIATLLLFVEHFGPIRDNMVPWTPRVKSKNSPFKHFSTPSNTIYPSVQSLYRISQGYGAAWCWSGSDSVPQERKTRIRPLRIKWIRIQTSINIKFRISRFLESGSGQNTQIWPDQKPCYFQPLLIRIHIFCVCILYMYNYCIYIPNYVYYNNNIFTTIIWRPMNKRFIPASWFIAARNK